MSRKNLTSLIAVAKSGCRKLECYPDNVSILARCFLREYGVYVKCKGQVYTNRKDSLQT
jgi:hypothetical protein